MTKLSYLLPALILLSCSLKDREADTLTESAREPSTPPKSQAGAVATAAEPLFEAPSDPEPPFPVRVVEQTAPDPIVLPRTPDEPAEAVPQDLHSQTRGLAEFLTSMCGVRLPTSSAALNLDSEIRLGQHTVQLMSHPTPGTSEFALDLVVSVSTKAIFVNDYKVADISCLTEDDTPCPPSFEDDTTGQRKYSVEANGDTPSMDDSYIVVPLLKQLTYFQRGRSALLKSLSGTAAAWAMECDAYTLAVDRAVPYHILASVIHTAGFADLTQARLVVLDENDSLAYVPLLSPRLNRTQTLTYHVVGDNWWRSQAAEDGFAIAYLAYSASLAADDFSGFDKPRLPYCFPAEIGWDRVLEDPGYARVASDQLDDYIVSIRESYPNLFSQDSSPAEVSGDAAEEDEALPEDEDSAEGDVISPPADMATEPAPSHPRLASAAMPSRLLPEEESRTAARGALSAALFVSPENLVVVLRTADGRVLEAVELAHGDLVKLYFHLAKAGTRTIHVGATWDLPLKTLVQAMDAVRYRCAVHAMSGKCKRWDPIFPTVYLFITRTGQFRPAGVPTKAVKPPDSKPKPPPPKPEEPEPAPIEDEEPFEAPLPALP